MHPPVDIAPLTTPVTGVSTDENNTTTAPARPLIEELTMRTTALALLTLLTTACVGDVGGGSAARGRERGDNAKKDTHAEHGDCTTTAPQKVEGSITIRAAADFDKLPKGCWDLWGKLRLRSEERRVGKGCASGGG